MLSLVLACLGAPTLAAAEPEDHPSVSRFAGSDLLSRTDYDYEEIGLFTAKDGAESQPIAGRVTAIGYRNPLDKTLTEVARNYEQGLKQGGFRIVWQCKQPGDCGENFWGAYRARAGSTPGHHGWKPTQVSGDVFEYFVAHANSGGKDTSVEVMNYQTLSSFGSKPHTIVRVIEAAGMEQGQVVADADALWDRIEAEGHVAVYGILFDTNKATIKPSSAEALGHVVQLLNDRPGLKVHVVGHTDDVGGLSKNRTLSEDRARAVVGWLGEQGIDTARLEPHGVAFLAPVTTNTTPEGRALNRRVELVRIRD